jgi:D-alanyl-D-alanine carboxypeptidase/D-alanyl-D-alanine-endopeptidase (penicillin-binding protein 4)
MLPVSLDSLLTIPDLAGATVCVTVADSSGAILYDHNGGTRVSPASNEKLFSNAFALWELGPDYRPQTNFWKRPDGVYVESTGSPTMAWQDLKTVAAGLGLDGTATVFVKEPYSPGWVDGWEIDDIRYRYGAPVAAFSVDQSGVDLWNRNGKLSIEPRPYGIRTETVDGPTDYRYDPIQGVLTVSGKLPNKTERIDRLGLPSAEGAASSWLGKSWRRVTKTPDAQPDLTIEGPPLTDIVAQCLERSDNNMAENLLLMGAGHEGALPLDPYPLALSRLKSFETRIVNIPAQEVLQRDGSGLTRGNLVTAHAIVDLLAWCDKQPTAELWKNSLTRPDAGTLAHRLKGIEFRGKTGSLSNVTALSGYLINSRKNRRIVSVLINGYSCSEKQAVQAVDNFVRFVAENGP